MTQSAPRATRITRPDSPFSTLQQRLTYVDAHPERAWSLLLETVPQWPAPPALAPVGGSELATGYAHPAGDRELRAAIAAREAAALDGRVPLDSVLVTHGGQNGLALLFRALARPGGQALCSAPTLRAMTGMMRAAGLRPTFFALRDGELDLDALRARCTPDVAFVYLNTPANPTGEVCSPASMASLVALLAERDIPLIADLVYDGFAVEGVRGVSPLALTGDWRRIYVVQSMSKNFGAPGLRIGWILSAPERIEPLAGELEREHIAISGVTQRQAAALLAQGNAALVDSLVERRRAILDELAGQPRLGFRAPRGGALIAIGVPVDDIELFADTLMVEHGIVVVTSGHYEGATGTPFIRFPLGIPPEVSRLAIRTIARLAEQFRG